MQLDIVINWGVVMMLAELQIVPIGTKGTSLSTHLAKVARIIDQSGLDYRVGPMGTTVEGEWDEIMQLAKQCHQIILKSADRVLTSIRIDDRKDKPGPGRIVEKVQSLEAKVGRPLKR